MGDGTEPTGGDEQDDRELWELQCGMVVDFPSYKVTPEMIEAGEAVWSNAHSMNVGTAFALEVIYRAMHAVRVRQERRR